MAAPLIGNPQDVLTTPYGYTGQMSPEAAVAEQALNRRRLITNMLMQRGMQPRQGQMAGRFYVAPSPLQHVTDLASILAGVWGNKNIEDEQGQIIRKDQQGVQDYIKNWNAKRQQVADAMTQAPAGPPQAPEAQTPPFGPRPDGPYQGEVGAVPMPDVGVQSAAPPSLSQPRASIAGQLNMEGLDMGNVQPADMSQMAQTQSPPVQPTSEPAPAQVPGPQKPTMDDLADLLTHQHPQVRAYGAMLAQQMYREQDYARGQANKDREFGLSERGLDARTAETRALRESTDAYRQAQLGTQLTGMGLNAEHNRALENIARENAGNTKELKKTEIGSRADIAKQHDETLKTIAGMKQQSKGRLPTSALKMQNEELDAIGAASSIKADMASIRSQIESGKLKLGPMSNLAGQARNYIGMSDDNSRNLASFTASLEKMRNESLRLNKGVQTEGDAVRAWDELVANMNDPKLVQQRLAEIEAMNDRAVNLRQMNIESIRQNFGVDPLDTTGYQQQPAAVGGNKGGGPAVGIVEDGYRFKGGNPSDPKSWEKVN